ncbi:MAG: serine/threonine protein kinase [Deltaproteobacteria bacterium]|nr:serine/threonine protein kinase [Deltaproteobacteria bacterium]
MEMLGPYALIDPLGSGSLCDVWRAVRPEEARRARWLAVKRPKPAVAAERAFVDTWLTLARTAMVIQHPFVVPILDAGEFQAPQGGPPQPVVVTEAVTGAALNALLNHLMTKTRDIPRAFALEVVHRVLEGLVHVHAATDPTTGAPLVHGDVCPANVMVSMDGRVRLCDPVLGRARTALSRLENQALRFRWHYMAPEEARGATPDARADLYAVGVMLHEMLTQRRMRRANRPEEFQQLVAAGTWTPLQQLNIPTDNGLDTLLFRALAPDPAARYPTAAAFLADAEAHMRAFGVEVPAAATASVMAQAFPQVLPAEETARALARSLAPAPTAPAEDAPGEAAPAGRPRPAGRRKPPSDTGKKLLMAVGGLALMGALGAGVIWLVGRRPETAARPAAPVEAPRDLTHLVGGRTQQHWTERLAEMDKALETARREEPGRVPAMEALRADLVRKGQALGLKGYGGE